MIPYDKQLHLITGFLIAYLLSYFLDSKQIILVVIVCAVGKEIYDEFKYGGFDLEDIIYTIFGLVLFNLCK